MNPTPPLINAWSSSSPCSSPCSSSSSSPCSSSSSSSSSCRKDFKYFDQMEQIYNKVISVGEGDEEEPGLGDDPAELMPDLPDLDQDLGEWGPPGAAALRVG